MWSLIILAMIASTICHPLEDLEDLEDQTQPPTEHENTIVHYVQNFQLVMSKLVSEQHANLTEHDMNQIKTTLEEFLVNFAKDLKETVENATYDNAEFQDGLPDATFIEIQERMKAEFPEIKDDTAKAIVFKLRRNLYVTRRKIDDIIKSSGKEFVYAEA